MPIYLNYIMFFISICPIGLIGIIPLLQPLNTHSLDEQERRSERSFHERMFSTNYTYAYLNKARGGR